MKKQQQTNYISEIDQLLAELRKKEPESRSQREERMKYERIGEQRDHKIETPEDII